MSLLKFGVWERESSNCTEMCLMFESWQQFLNMYTSVIVPNFLTKKKFQLKLLPFSYLRFYFQKLCNKSSKCCWGWSDDIAVTAARVDLLWFVWGNFMYFQVHWNLCPSFLYASFHAIIIHFFWSWKISHINIAWLYWMHHSWSVIMPHQILRILGADPQHSGIIVS